MAATNILFKLKDKNSAQPTPINLLVYFNKTQFKYATGEKILPAFWNDSTTSEKGVKTIIQRAFVKSNDAAKLDPATARENIRVNFRLSEFQAATKSYLEHFTFQKTPPTPEKLKELFDRDFRPKTAEPEQPKGMTLNGYIKKYIQEITAGKRLTEEGTLFKPNTLKNFNSFKAKFDLYQKDSHLVLDFQHITIGFHTKFQGYFTQKGYKLNTIGRHIRTLKTLMRAAKDEGFHDNTEFERKAFTAPRVKVDNVYLTETELKNIADLDLSATPHLDKVRDVFLVGCFTALRYSDYSRLNKTNIKILEDGTTLINLYPGKVGGMGFIPMKPELYDILAKYDFTLPKTYEQKVNKWIKIIAADAKITEPCLIRSIVGGEKVTESKPKCKLITSHTARRTGATLMVLAGIPIAQAMMITGHSSEREFLGYIKITAEENAKILSKHDYYKRTPLKLENDGENNLRTS